MARRDDVDAQERRETAGLRARAEAAEAEIERGNAAVDAAGYPQSRGWDLRERVHGMAFLLQERIEQLEAVAIAAAPFVLDTFCDPMDPAVVRLRKVLAAVRGTR